MVWLEKHIDAYFKLNGIFTIIMTLLSIWGLYSMTGLPSNSMATWKPHQWAIFKALWIPMFCYWIIYLFLAALYFMKKYITFPICLLFWGTSLDTAFINLNEVLESGLIYPAVNLSGISVIAAFIFNLVGTILWLRVLIRKNPRVNTK